MASPLDYNPAGWWRAADSGAQGSTFVATDLSGNGRHATQTTLAAHPTKVYRPTGIYDWAWSFDGTNQWMLASDMLSSQGAQTIIALAKSGNMSLTTRRAWGFCTTYSLFGNGTQWGYYAKANDTIANLGGNTANWTVVAVRQFQASAVGEGYTPPTLVATVGGVAYDLSFAGIVNGKPSWYAAPYDEYIDNITIVWTNPDYCWACLTTGGAYAGTWYNNSVLGNYTYYGEGGGPTTVTISTPDHEGAYGYRDNGVYAGFWLPKLLTGNFSLAIGAESYLGGQKWVGHIADVMVFNDFLSIEAIQDIYTNYFVPRYFVQPIVAKQRAGRMAIGGLTI